MSNLPSTHLNNLKILRGVAKFEPLRADGLYGAMIALSPASEFTETTASTESKYVSQESGIGEILDTTVLTVDRTFDVKCERINLETVGLFMIGDLSAVSQAAASVTTERTGVVKPNGSFQLGGTTVNNGAGVFNISAATIKSYEGLNASARANSTAYLVGDVVIPATPNLHWYVCTVAGTSHTAAPTFPTDGTTVTETGGVKWQDMGLITYVAGTDYELDLDQGQLHILTTGAIATAYSRLPIKADGELTVFTLNAAYTAAVTSLQQIASSALASKVGRFWFYEDNPKGDNNRWLIPSAALAPNGNFALKSGTNYGSLGFKITAQKPASGQSVYITAVP